MIWRAWSYDGLRDWNRNVEVMGEAHREFNTFFSFSKFSFETFEIQVIQHPTRRVFQEKEAANSASRMLYHRKAKENEHNEWRHHRI